MEELLIYDDKEFKINTNTKITKEIAIQILDARKIGIGTKPIAKKINIDASTVRRFLSKNGIVNDRVEKLKAPKLERKCKICNVIKPNSEFRCRGSRQRLGFVTTAYECYCNECVRNESIKQRKTPIKPWHSLTSNRNINPEDRKEHNRKWYAEYVKTRKKYDSSYKLKKIISSCVNNYLRRNFSSKKNKSSLSSLDYSINDLKKHIEDQFEPWMNWDNWGKYIKSKWDDNDQSTWKWQIDHIIPQSSLKYESMEEENFKKCWALSNLRPLSAKENLLKSDKL